MKTVCLVFAENLSPELRQTICAACEQEVARRKERLVLFTAPGDPVTAMDWAHCLDEQCACVMVAGGDGTVAAVAHELVGGTIPLGIIPVGTGNLVARELGMPLAMNEAVALLFGERRTRRLDAMRIAGRTYLLNAGVGVNAAVAVRTSRVVKTLFGIAAYVGSAVWSVLRARPIDLTVTVDGVTERFEATDVLISNCGLLARGLHPHGPNIRPDDGCLNLCVVCLRSPLQYPLHYLQRWLRWRRADRVVHDRVILHEVTLSSSRPRLFQADGDGVGETPVTIALLPAALPVIVPMPPTR